MAKKEIRPVPRKPTTTQAPHQPALNPAEADIDRAVARVHQLYGPDLSVFFKAVHDQLNLERHESRDQKRELRLDYKR